MKISEIERNAQSAAAFLKALANPHRLLVLCHLTEGERSVGELEGLLGLRQPHLSQHLARLRRDRLVKTRRASRTIFYSLGSPEAERLIRLLYDMFCAEAGAPAKQAAAARQAPRTARRAPRTRAAAGRKRRSAG